MCIHFYMYLYLFPSAIYFLSAIFPFFFNTLTFGLHIVVLLFIVLKF